MSIENRFPSEKEIELPNQPERIDKALQSLLEVGRQIEPVGVSNKQEIEGAIIILNYLLGGAYNELLERNSDPAAKADEDYQQALRTIQRYIQQHIKEPDETVDADYTSENEFAN
jgi:hypothetical protein